MTTLYEGMPVGRRGWSILAGCCVVGFLLVFFGAGGLHDQSILVLAALLVVVIGGPFALMLFSKNFYGRVELTAEQLRVGRERILVQDIWPREAIDTTDTARPSAVDRVGNSATAGTGETPTEQARMAGDACAVPLGSDSVTIRVRGERVIVTTTDRAELLAALRTAFSQTPAQPHPDRTA